MLLSSLVRYYKLEVGFPANKNFRKKNAKFRENFLSYFANFFAKESENHAEFRDKFFKKSQTTMIEKV